MVPAASVVSIPGIQVVEGHVPHALKEPTMKERTWQAAHGVFLFRGGRRSARFLVEGGQKITIDRNPLAEDDLICAQLFTSVLAVLLRQRGLLVLHANVVVTPRGAIAILGESGSGKSTSQAGLIKHGCSMLADDVAALRLEKNETILALPGIPRMNLCEDAAIKLGHDIQKLRRNPLVNNKVLIPALPEESISEAVPLYKIYLINKHQGGELIIKPLHGTEKFSALQECIYGPQLPEEMPSMFPFIMMLMNKIEIISLYRPTRGCSVDKVVKAILHG
jgi:hypothetical protein